MSKESTFDLGEVVSICIILIVAMTFSSLLTMVALGVDPAVTSESAITIECNEAEDV